MGLISGQGGSFSEGRYRLTEISRKEQIPGTVLTPADVARERLYQPLRNVPFKLPGNMLVGKGDLEHFVVEKRVWKANPDGSLTNQIAGSVIRPDFHAGPFLDQNVHQFLPSLLPF